MPPNPSNLILLLSSATESKQKLTAAVCQRFFNHNYKNEVSKVAFQVAVV